MTGYPAELPQPTLLDGEDRAPHNEALDGPDKRVLHLYRRPAPRLPIEVFGCHWSNWITEVADAASCPVDYVAVPLLATASVLIGHARWAQATPGWIEPPHLWTGVVGDSGTGKSPGADCLMRDVVPALEQKMRIDFPEKVLEWRATAEHNRASEEKWKEEVRKAHKAGKEPPLPPVISDEPEPQEPRLRQNDVTIEKVATLLAMSSPKGLLVVRDELAGWIAGMSNYGAIGRPFWVEAYGGRPYRVERQKSPEPIIIPRLAVAVYGTTQPDKIAALMRAPDDGLLSRLLWSWPEPVPFHLGSSTPGVAWAIAALDRLRELELPPGAPAPVLIPLSDDARNVMAQFGRVMQEQQAHAGGLLRSAIGKARGQALRLSLVLSFMQWCASSDGWSLEGMLGPPAKISAETFEAACRLVRDYFIPTAERVYGDAALPAADRNAATIARWILRTKAKEVHVRHLQRTVRLPGLHTAEDIHAACARLGEADWLDVPSRGTFQSPPRQAYPVNPKVFEEPFRMMVPPGHY